MSRKKLSLRRPSSLASTTPPAVPSASMYGVSGTGYPGAQHSTNRGYIYWPTLDPKRELTNPARREMARRLHALMAASGIPNRVLIGIRNLVIGIGLVPRAITADREWNRLATRYYENRSASALSFDVTGRFSGWEMQRRAYETRLKDGDAAIVYSKSASGRTMRKLYSGLVIGNATDVSDQSQWIDGVYLDALERPSVYRFLTEQGKRSRDIATADMQFLAKYPEPGSIRGEMILKHALNKIIDINEVHSSWMQQIKNSAMIGYYLAAPSTPAGSQNMPAEVMQRMFKNQLSDKTNAASQKVTIKTIMGHGNEIAEVPAGFDIKTLLDERPHPNQKDFMDEMIRDIAWGAGMSSDLLWNIYKLGGANTRYVLADAQTFVEVEQDSIVYGWLMRDYVQEVADAMATGALPMCQDPEWWQHGWTPPARQTVDFGRDGSIYLEEYSRGLITTDRYFALKGQDAREEFIAECDFAEFRREEMARRKLTEADFAYQRTATAPAPAQAPTQEEDPAEDPNQDPEDPNADPENDQKKNQD